MTDERHLQVFISHATEDKKRFVLPFAAKLRERGVDAWVDQWEMLPGDSLVGKIFREGLDQASAVIVVLSRVSIAKRWVAEELDAAVVKRINEGSRLIPIVLDGLDPAKDVPAPIRHLLFESVPNTDMIDAAVERVVRTLFGGLDRPPLGTPPAYTASAVVSIRGLDRIDSLVLRAAGAAAVRDHATHFHTAEFVASVTREHGLSEDEAIESLEVLDSARLVKISRTLGSGINGMSIFELTSSGLETYLDAYESDYARIETTVLARLAEWPAGQGSASELATAANVAPLIVEHILARCRSRGLLQLTPRTFGGDGPTFYGISPRLRRIAEQ